MDMKRSADISVRKSALETVADRNVRAPGEVCLSRMQWDMPLAPHSLKRSADISVRKLALETVADRNVRAPGGTRGYTNEGDRRD